MAAQKAIPPLTSGTANKVIVGAVATVIGVLAAGALISYGRTNNWKWFDRVSDGFDN